MKTVLNVFGILISIPLSILLLTVLLLTPIVSSISSLVTADTIKELTQEVVQDFDYSTLIPSDESFQESLENSGMDAELVEGLLKTSAFHEIFNLYIEDLFASIKAGTMVEPQLTEEVLKTILHEHIDEFVPIMKQLFEAEVGGEITFTDEEIKAELTTLIDESAGELLTMFPTAEDLGLLSSDDTMSDETAQLYEAIHLFNSGIILRGCIIAIVVLSLLILALRFVKFEGFMWLGVVYVLSFFPSISMAYLLKTFDLQTIADIPAGAIGILSPLLHTASSKISNASYLILALAIVFIAIFIFGRRALKKNIL